MNVTITSATFLSKTPLVNVFAVISVTNRHLNGIPCTCTEHTVHNFINYVAMILDFGHAIAIFKHF